MNNRNKSIVCVVVGMAAGGFTSGELNLSPLAKAVVVGLVAATVAALMLFLLRPRKTAKIRWEMKRGCS